MDKTIFVVLKIYRQIDGEYFAIEPERAFFTQAEASKYIANRSGTWDETRPVPIANPTGANVTMPIAFRGFLGVHEVLLNEEKLDVEK
jgi:hypothetical protein